MNQPPPPIVVVNTTKRDTLIGILAGAVIITLLAFAFMQMSKGVVGQGLTGTILSKTFTPLPEEQITIGKGGIRERAVDGEYRFEVQVESNVYTVWVE
ncbi:MAG: hypothetical protein WCH43_17455, partial [Verrucomicrobiota bacterium]